MDTSNSLLHVRVLDLMNSSVEEDHLLAEQCRCALAELIEKLKPVLKYICAPARFTSFSREDANVRCCHLVNFCDNYFPDERRNQALYLTEDGKFLTEMPVGSHTLRVDAYPSDSLKLTLETGSKCWEVIDFAFLFESLQTLFHKAEQVKQKHLESFRQRSELLDKLVATIRGLAPTSYDIRCEYTGSFNKHTVNISGDAECMRVVLVVRRQVGVEDEERVLFTGPKFDEKELVRRLAVDPSPVAQELLSRLKSKAS